MSTGPTIVAELSANHLGSLDRALELVDAVARAGAHAVKLQTWAKHHMVLDPAAVAAGGPWKGERLVDLYARAWTPWAWHGPIFQRCAERGIEGFTSVFDIESLAYLEREHRLPRYKIASFELVDLALVGAVARTRKPLILSTGMATLVEITEAVRVARANGCTSLTLLKCTSDYPAAARSANLRTMADLGRRFQCQAGLSDHTLGIGVAITAAAMGASMIEKHVTLSRSDGGPDAAFSLEPQELADLARAAPAAVAAPGEIAYGPTIAEAPQRELRRSLYLSQDVRAGETLTTRHVRSARPAAGLAPRYLDRVIGSKALRDAIAGTPVTWALIEPADAIADAGRVT